MKKYLIISPIFCLALIGCNKRNMDVEYFQMKNDVLFLSKFCQKKPELKITRKSSDNGSVKFYCEIINKTNDEFIQESSEYLIAKKYNIKFEDKNKYRWCNGGGTVLEINIADGIGVSSYLNSMDCEKFGR